MKSLVKTEKSVFSENEEVYSHAPSFFVDSENMPEIKEWPVGEKYFLTIEVEVASLYTPVEDEKVSGDLRVLAYKVVNKPKDDKSLPD